MIMRIPYYPGEGIPPLEVVIETKDNKDGTTFTKVKYDYPDGVQVIAFTNEGRIIAIQETSKMTGITRLGTVGGTMGVGARPRSLKEIYDVAERELKEETGHKAGSLELLSSVFENSGKSDRLIHLVLARDCYPVSDPEGGIEVWLFDPGDFLKEFLPLFLGEPEKSHAGGNTLKGIFLAYWKLGIPINPGA